jgi:hypothetical protein
MTRRWTVTLYNQAALGSCTAEGRTRRQAYERARLRAGREFLGHRLKAFDGSDWALAGRWDEAFAGAITACRRGYTMGCRSSPHGYSVEIRRLET